MLTANYKDPEFEGNIKYYLTHNLNGTVSFTDATDYKTPTPETIYVTSSYINTTNSAVNSMASLYSTWISPYTPLKTDYVDSEWTGQKEFSMSQSGDYVIFADQTQYTQQGDNYGADDINATNTMLNNLEQGYLNGYGQILTLLQQKGATSTSDLIAALNAVVERAKKLGEDQGVIDAKNNPNTYNVYTQAQYNSLKGKLTTWKNNIDGYKTQINDTDSTCDNFAYYAHRDINSIEGGDDKASVESAEEDAIDEMNLIASRENDSHRTYVSNTETAIVQLRYIYDHPV